MSTTSEGIDDRCALFDDNALSQVLIGLGSSVAEIAAALQSKQIQGVRNTVRFFNPIVRYVQRELQASNSDLDVIQPDTLRMTLPDRTREAKLPSPVREFIDAFNRGDYPELELPPDFA